MEKIPQLRELSSEELLQLSDELVCNVIHPERPVPPDTEIEAMLDQAWSQYQAAPQSASTLDELKRRLDEKLGRP